MWAAWGDGGTEKVMVDDYEITVRRCQVTSSVHNSIVERHWVEVNHVTGESEAHDFPNALQNKEQCHQENSSTMPFRVRNRQV